MQNFLDTLREMGNTFSMADIWDVIDILIVAFIIYKLLVLLKNTNAMTGLKGLVLVLALMGFAALFQLHTLSWILTNVIQVGLLALVIIFQPELRKLLEQVGRSRFPKFFGREVNAGAMNTAILQTVEACTDLSRSKTGALIIFERRTVLDDEIKTGTTMDASVAGELVKNIFFNKAPLHDGAMIVRDGRIVAAGCMLPLTNNPHLSKELGMRHRAAIGMSENSDAVCVVVSEETGSISVAMDGTIKRRLTPETLGRILQRELLPAPEEEQENRLSRFAKKFKGKKRP